MFGFPATVQEIAAAYVVFSFSGVIYGSRRVSTDINQSPSDQRLRPASSTRRIF